jgi:RND family efflux transporter MFP subunit
MRVSAVVLLVALTACNKKDDTQATKAPPAPPVKVEAIAAVEAPAPLVLTLTGLIAADQRSEVTADTQGKVLAVMIDLGQRVKFGQPVVRLDVRTAALSAREAQANLASARAQKQLAEEECKRAQALLDKGAITRSEYDRQTTQCTSALQQVSAAQARAEMITKSVADGLVRAPFDGIVASKSVTPGEWVAPGRPLFTLVDDDPLKIALSVSEKAVRAMRLGQKVTLTSVARPDKEYTATVSRIGAEIGRTRSLTVEATLDSKVGTPTGRDALEAIGGREIEARVSGEIELVPGMFAEAHVVIGQMQRPVVPADAVALRGKTWHAFVIVNGEVHDRVIQLGTPPAKGMEAIVKGVAVGEQLVRHVRGGNPQIVDGLRVETTGASPPPAPAAN